VTSLEKEIMRLQEVLREREAEISALEASLNDKSAAVTTVQEPSLAVTNGDAVPASYLSPNTLDHFEDIRKTMLNGFNHPESGQEKNGSVSEPDENIDRLNELML